ncbi:HNH endonuclease [uncultured Zhongshania sp.]|uniref:HNH endonuclease n=1 Tax=uncultured Zhongshania sp. TaxID=1642288 RepID=UPI0025F4FEED|nr:HNH endonuclease [uncultured Zhongshania sp.]
MAGTKHFTRMHYHVSRGLREIVAPRQTMPKKEWEEIKRSFSEKCAYCGKVALKENRGIVADHVVPATEFGEFVKGNIVPACQTCNDSRGNKCWREFINTKQGSDLADRIAKIEQHLEANPYTAPTAETVLSAQELKKYKQLLEQWDAINAEAKELYNSKHNG